MSERSIESPQQFVTCHCEHCGGGIEFDASEFAKHESRAAECPHCRKEAKIFVPKQKLPPDISNDELQNLEALNGLGYFYTEGERIPKDYVKAVMWFRQAAEQGLPDAQNNLGIAYDHGNGVPKDQIEAAKWFRLAAEQGNLFAQRNLGIAYCKGEGVPEDLTEALKWFRMAAEQGESGSQLIIGNFQKPGFSGFRDRVIASHF